MLRGGRKYPPASPCSEIRNSDFKPFKQVLESPLSRPVTYEFSNMGGPQRQCLPTILSSFAPKK